MTDQTQAKDKILIIGGYGAVGSVLSTELAGEYKEQVIIAGRNVEKAKTLIFDEGLPASPATVDIQKRRYDHIDFSQVHTVISCVEIQGSTFILEKCLEYNANLVEVGTSYEQYERFFSYEQPIQKAEITLIPSVGLMPGISNVFAYNALSHFDHIQRVYSYLMLGLGDAHGLDAVRWMLAYANKDIHLKNQPNNTVKKSFSEPHTVRFLHETKNRTCYLFDFADQHTIPSTTGAQRAETRLCFDSRLITKSLDVLKRLGLLNNAQDWDPKKAKQLVDLLPFGSAKLALQTHIYGSKNKREGQIIHTAYGQNEAEVTAFVTAAIVKKIISGEVQQGIVPVEKSIKLAELEAYLQTKNVHFLNQPAW